MEYSPLHPVIWLAFAAFVVVVWAVVARFHRKHPDYGRFDDQAGPGEKGRT
ncbi:MAG: hypothetical protein AB1916_02010 [Thermodesulfobacteriota bacterium]